MILIPVIRRAEHEAPPPPPPPVALEPIALEPQTRAHLEQVADAILEAVQESAQEGTRLRLSGLIRDVGLSVPGRRPEGSEEGSAEDAPALGARVALWDGRRSLSVPAEPRALAALTGALRDLTRVPEAPVDLQVLAQDLGEVGAQLGSKPPELPLSAAPLAQRSGLSELLARRVQLRDVTVALPPLRTPGRGGRMYLRLNPSGQSRRSRAAWAALACAAMAAGTLLTWSLLTWPALTGAPASSGMNGANAAAAINAATINAATINAGLFAWASNIITLAAVLMFKTWADLRDERVAALWRETTVTFRRQEVAGALTVPACAGPWTARTQPRHPELRAQVARHGQRINEAPGRAADLGGARLVSSAVSGG